jgi:sphinganine-1-phosphate aldolase
MRTRFPKARTEWATLKKRMFDMKRRDVNWRDGRSPLHVYYAGEDVLDVVQEAYCMFMSENALAPAAFPSLAMMETEVVQCALDLFGAKMDAAGSVTTGGTESIILAMKAARDRSIKLGIVKRGIPEVLMPRTAHPIFDKAAHYLGLRAVRVAVGSDYQADVAAIAANITERTILLVASAPSLPYGIIDPVVEMGKLAIAHDIWLHVDACIGGYLAPFVKKLGYRVPDFDFTVPGVKSISADLHKYGFAAKGASTILYSDAESHSFQFTEFSDWPKGKYFTPTVLGSRSGGAIAAAWAVMNYLGEEGYLEIAGRIMATQMAYIEGILDIGEFEIIGSPHLALFSFTSRRVDIEAVADELEGMGWYISRISEPRGIHQMVNMAHEPAVRAYLHDLRVSVERVKMFSLKGANAQVVTY